MPRIRTVKPEFWTSGQILECSTITRLLFIGLWNFCDDTGKHPLRPKQIKAEVFPADELTEDDILGMVKELSDNGLITIYSVDNKDYFQVNGWHHQRIDKPQPPKYPEPIQERSGNGLGTLPPDSKGKDSKGKEGIGKDTPDADAPDDFERLWAMYPERAGSNPKRDALIAFKATLKRGKGLQEIEDGLHRYIRFCEATGKIGTETVMQAKTFFGPSERWSEAWKIPRRGAAISQANDDAIARAMEGYQ